MRCDTVCVFFTSFSVLYFYSSSIRLVCYEKQDMKSSLAVGILEGMGGIGRTIFLFPVVHV